MKNKKLMVVICIATILILIISIVLFIFLKKNTQKNEDTEIIQNKADTIIKGTKENPIELEGFEATNIDIFKTTDTSLEVKATIVNKSDVLVKGFFIEIGLYDDKGEMVTEIAENHTEEIKSGENYILEASVVGIKNTLDITSAKILKLEKETTSNMEEAFDTNQINSNR